MKNKPLYGFLLSAILFSISSLSALSAAELTFISPSSFSTPDSDAVVSLPLTVSGTASADAGVSQVSISIMDTRTSKWWGPKGWRAAWAGTKANVTQTSAKAANWNITFNLQNDKTGSGSYLLIAGVDDSAGTYHSHDNWQSYFSAQSESVKAAISYTKPTANQSVDLPLNITGSVTSPTGIAEVSVAIMDLSSYKWWDDKNKRWSAAWVGSEAILTPVNFNRSTWRYTFNPENAAGSGKYRIVTGFNDADWAYTPTTWKREFVGFEQSTTNLGITYSNLTNAQAVNIPVTIKGSAASADGVAEVSLSILDLETYKWWKDGRWDDSWARMKANITSRSGNRVNWQYTFDASNAEGSGRYTLLSGMSDLNWKYKSETSWMVNFKKKEDSQVEQVSPGVYQLADIVEYNWTAGCVATAAAMMIGYWDRNGYGGLITGDSTQHSEAVSKMMASQGHIDDYLHPTKIIEKFNDEHGLIPDKSEAVPTHTDDSVADFVHGSHSVRGRDFGVAAGNGGATGVHGWANMRGYGGFKTETRGFNNFTFDEFRIEILAGRPIIVTVDVGGGGRINHLVLGVAFNDNTNEIGVLNGWGTKSKINWIDWHKPEAGWNWGQGMFTKVIPPEKANLRGPNTVLLENKGGNKAYYRDGKINNSSAFNVLTPSKLSNLGIITTGIASADGHRFWVLRDDAVGSSSLYQGNSNGDGGFSWLLLSEDSGPNRTKTAGFATYDGKTFWQLFNDGFGTLALVKWSYDPAKRIFIKNGIITSGTGLSLTNTLGAAMRQNGTLLVYVKEGVNNVSLYSLDVRNKNAVPKLLRSNVQGMDSLVDFASFEPKATVASDGNGATASRSTQASTISQTLRLGAKIEDIEALDNWGVAEDEDTAEFGSGARVIPAPTVSSTDAAEDDTNADGIAANGVVESDSVSTNDGGAAGLDLFYLLSFLLLLVGTRRSHIAHWTKGYRH